ncbi:MAG: hypothetical protein QF605_10095, partial [Rhodospirillales bacterium]|nr:hypothetical protein [Rhodospirillales bacterium]
MIAKHISLGPRILYLNLHADFLAHSIKSSFEPITNYLPRPTALFLPCPAAGKINTDNHNQAAQQLQQAKTFS